MIVLAVAACHQSSSSQQQASAGPLHVSPPSSATNAQAWEDYMVKVSHADLKGISAKPYLYEILAPSDPRASHRNPNLQQALTQMATGNRFPGNVIAVGGPDPSETADVLVAVFGVAKAGSLKGLTVLYIGDANDQARAEKAITATGAAFRFVAL